MSHILRSSIALSVLLLGIGWHGETLAVQLTATWVDSSTDATGFSVERSTGTTGTFGEIATTGAGTTTYTDSTVSGQTTYCYRVRAYNATAYSDYSNVACAITAQAFGLTVAKMGAGSGTVISTPAGILCGTSCSASYASGTAVTLTPTAAAGSIFTGWSGGGCTGTGSCTVTLTSTTTVTATFALSQSVTQSVTLTVSASGKGTVTSTPAGINCGTSCSASYASGTAVTLTATPASQFVFRGWSGGGCTGTGACTVSMTAATTVTATFTNANKK